MNGHDGHALVHSLPAKWRQVHGLYSRALHSVTAKAEEDDWCARDLTWTILRESDCTPLITNSWAAGYEPQIHAQGSGTAVLNCLEHAVHQQARVGAARRIFSLLQPGSLQPTIESPHSSEL